MVARGRASVKMYKEKSKTILKNHPFVSKYSELNSSVRRFIVEDIVFNTVLLSLYAALLGPCSLRFVLMREYRRTTTASGEMWTPAGG